VSAAKAEFSQHGIVGARIDRIAKAAKAAKTSKERVYADWGPVDILVFVHQIATAWVAQPDLQPPHEEDRARFLAARRAAIVAAVERLFPAAAN